MHSASTLSAVGVLGRCRLNATIVCTLFVLAACNSSGGSGAASQQQGPETDAAIALQTTGPSTTFGNFGKAITTDGAGYVDAIWLQGGSSNNDGSIIYIGTGSIMFAQSADQGVTWSKSELTAVAANTSLPRIASSGPDMYVVWPAQDAASGALQIFLLHGKRSGDQVQWSSPLVISDTPAGSNATFPVVAADGQAIHVAWSDNRNDGVTEVYYTGSLDAGATWSAPVAISLLDGFNSWTPSIAADAQQVYIAWTDARFGTSRCTTDAADCHEVLYLRSSADHGRTWDSESQLTCDAGIYTYAPSIAVEGNSIHIAYFQGSPYPPGVMQLYYLRADEGSSVAACSGTQGTRAAINMQYPRGDAVLSAWRPNIAVFNGVIHMVWWGEFTDDYSTGLAKVYYTESSDGLTWAPATSLTPHSDGRRYRSFSPNVSLSLDGSTAYILWEDHRDDMDALDPNYQVFFESKSF